MLTTILLVLVILVVVVSIAIWLIKMAVVRVLMIGVLGVVVYVLFHVAFIWDFQEMDDVLKFDKWLAPETIETLSQGYNEFDSKRGEYAVIDQQLMKENIDKTINEAWVSAGETYATIDKEELRKRVILEYEKYGKEAVDLALLQMEEQLSKQQETP